MVKTLYDIYQGMFKQEDLSGTLRITENPAAPLQCTRSSFIALLSFLKYHVKADWKPIIEDRLPKLINSDYKQILLAPYAPDFLLQCHLHQLVTTYSLSLEWGQQALGPNIKMPGEISEVIPLRTFRLSSFHIFSESLERVFVTSFLA
jgi:hypothetical protein